jgi:hypothetical protein
VSTLLINGCSFARIWKPEDSFVKSLGCDIAVNIGKDGTSLPRTVRSTIEWIAQNGDPTFVLIPITLCTRWELSIARKDDVLDGTWYPMQIREYLQKDKISTDVDFKRLEELSDLYYASIPNIRTYYDRAFTDMIALCGFLDSRKVDYLMFDICNNFTTDHLIGYQGFEKIKFLNQNKKIIDIFNFCGNHFMWESLQDSEKKSNTDPYMHHHDLEQYQLLEKYLLSYLKF